MFEKETIKKERYWATSLREKREQKGISLRDLARKLGLSPAFLSKVENRKQFVNKSTYKNICKAIERI